MSDSFVKFLSIFIPVKKYRRIFRDKFLKKEKFTRVINGNGNILNCPEGFQLDCIIFGDNNKVYIDKNDLPGDTRLTLFIGVPEVPCNNCVLKVGKNFSGNGTMIRICEDNTEVVIGDDCMFSNNVNIWASDTHTITNLQGECINEGKFVNIGKHVWLCTGVTILKNSKIADDCICGCNSNVSGVFDLPNCVIAGNPAKICKKILIGVEKDQKNI